MERMSPRAGFTLMELVLVLAVLIILAAITVPTLGGLRGNADQKRAADQVRARIADARGLAMQEGMMYRLAVHKDGTRIRVAPDTPDFSQVPASPDASAGAKAIETKLINATIQVADAGSAANPDEGSQDDWNTIGAFMPNGTCREDWTLIEVYESSYTPIRIQLRGLTGTCRVLPFDAQNPQSGKGP